MKCGHSASVYITGDGEGFILNTTVTHIFIADELKMPFFVQQSEL